MYSINQASDYWGIRCLRYEIKDIHVPPRVKESMQMQVRLALWAGEAFPGGTALARWRAVLPPGAWLSSF